VPAALLSITTLPAVGMQAGNGATPTDRGAMGIADLPPGH